MISKNKLIKVAVAIALITIYAVSEQHTGKQTRPVPEQNNTLLRQAISNHKSDIQVSGSGQVSKVLPDDNQGSRHQRFLVVLDSGESILIAHNIDLAPGIPDLHKGDTIRFNGEFQWNHKGGLVHWTHRDPRNSHVHGCLEHNGSKYW